MTVRDDVANLIDKCQNRSDIDAGRAAALVDAPLDAERIHYAEGVAELAMKQRDVAEECHQHALQVIHKLQEDARVREDERLRQKEGKE